ncbi:MAG: hypothetical protein IT442_14755 [Phycisphaeraceae bacterium]|nr:hypothetical protein [Phycisphaeraceae bacterium]
MFWTRRRTMVGRAGCDPRSIVPTFISRLCLPILGLVMIAAGVSLAGCRTDPEPQPRFPQSEQPLPAGMVRLVLRRVTWIAGEPAVEAVLRPMDQLPVPMRSDPRATIAAAANGLVWRWTDPATWKQIEDRGLIRDVSWAGAPSSTLLMPGWVGRLEVRRSLLADIPTRLHLRDARGQQQQIEALIAGSGCFVSYQVFASGEKQVELTPYFQQSDPGQAIVLSDLRCRLMIGGEVVYVLTAVPSPIFEAPLSNPGGPHGVEKAASSDQQSAPQSMAEVFMGPSLTAHGSRRVGLIFSVEGI